MSLQTSYEYNINGQAADQRSINLSGVGHAEGERSLVERLGAPSMGKSIIDLSPVAIVGLDLAKHVFQGHGVDVRAALWSPLRSSATNCLSFSLVAALPGWARGQRIGAARARELITLGHEACVMPSAYVRRYIRRQKNDASDAAAICEAVTRPSMRFVSVRFASRHQ
jgi:transposase